VRAEAPTSRPGRWTRSCPRRRAGEWDLADAASREATLRDAIARIERHAVPALARELERKQIRGLWPESALEVLVWLDRRGTAERRRP